MNKNEYKKEWRKKNKSRILEYKRKRYKENPERENKYVKNWKKKHRLDINNYNKEYNLKESNRIKARIRSMTWNKYGAAKVCSLCDSVINVEHHHIPPYDKDNFIDVCNKCHNKIKKEEEI